jgi:glucosamine 6-phosphate synthetase-like amidotransferase/phosphosugar isomerase protein
MCGIIGVIGRVREGEWQQTHDLLTRLLVGSIDRGRDATGFAAVASPLNDPSRHRLITDKQPMSASEFVRWNAPWRQLRHRRCAAVLGHVRAATSGTPRINANNHPHLFARERYALVHNGWYTNGDDVVDRFSLVPNTHCDSEVAARLVEAAASVSDGLLRCLSHLKGSQALAVVDSRTGAVWCCTDGNRPLWVARLADRRRMVIASTADIVLRAAEEVLGDCRKSVESLIPVAPGYVHCLTVDGRVYTPYTRMTGSA